MLEDGSEVDLSHLQVDSAGLKELYRVLESLKTELLMKTLSKGSLNQIEKDILELKKNTKPPVLSHGKEVEQALTRMAGQQSQLHSLQIQIMQTETVCHDLSRSLQQLANKVTVYQPAPQSSTSGTSMDQSQLKMVLQDSVSAAVEPIVSQVNLINQSQSEQKDKLK